MERKKIVLSGWLLGSNFLCLLIFWGGMSRKSFNADTIFHMMVEDADVLTNIEAGRYIISLGDWLLLKLGLRVTTNTSITMLATLLLFAAAMFVIYQIFKKWEPAELLERIGFYIGVNLVFLNVLFAELLMFRECSVYFAIGYLFAALGVWCFTRQKYVGMVAALSVAVCTYQYTVIFAAILIAFYICMEQKAELSLKAVLREMIGIAVCILSGVLNLMSVKLLEKAGVITKFGKKTDFGNIWEKLEQVWDSIVGLYRNASGILPDLWMPLLFILAIWGLIICGCVKARTYKKLLFIFLVWAGSTLLLYVIPMAQVTVYFPPRMSFCFFAIQGMMVLLAYQVNRTEVYKILSLLCGGWLIVQLLFSNFIVTNHFVSNTLDKVYANMVYQEILQYEEETGIEIKNIAAERDAYSPNGYEEVSYHEYQINERAPPQVATSPLNMVSGRKFDFVDMDEAVFEQYFKDKNWDYLDVSQQLYIEGDTVYWCVF